MPQQNPVRLYVATHEGIVVARYDGGDCPTVAEGCRGAIVDAVAVAPNAPEIAFAAVTHVGLFRSDDAGRHWEKVLDGDMRAVTIDPADSRVVYAGTEPVRLYRSEDRGQKWEEMPSLQSLPADTRRMLGQPPARPEDLKRFRKGRQEWSFPIPPHLGHITQIYVRPDDPREVLLSIEHGGVAFSDNRGQSWTDASAGIEYLDIHKVLRLPGDEDRYVCSSARGLYASASPRDGWTRAERGCERNYFHAMLVLPSAAGAIASILVCAAENSPGFWPATMGDGKWAEGARGARCALYRSDDGAASWRRVGVGADLPAEMDPMIWGLVRHPHDPNAIFAGTGEVARGYAFGTGGRGAILLSSDQGESWAAIKRDLRAVRHVVAVPE
jgi:BNR-Asp box repeat